MVHETYVQQISHIEQFVMINVESGISTLRVMTDEIVYIKVSVLNWMQIMSHGNVVAQFQSWLIIECL